MVMNKPTYKELEKKISDFLGMENVTDAIKVGFELFKKTGEDLPQIKLGGKTPQSIGWASTWRGYN